MKVKETLTAIPQWLMTTGFLLGLLSTGLTLIAYGNATQDPFWSSIGGSLFGASLGSLIGRLSTLNLTENLKEIVRQSVKDSFVSDEEKLGKYRANWHIYHMTRMGGEWVWRHTCIDFRHPQTPGRLMSETYLIDQDRKKKFYTVEAGRRDARFIIFLRDKESQEPAATYVFPLAGYGVQNRHLGMVFLQTWDHDHAISPAIASLSPLKKGTKMGTLPPHIAREIDQVWRDGTDGAIPPRFA